MATPLSMTEAARLTRLRDRVFLSILYSLFVVYCLTVLYPFYFLIINSLQAARSAAVLEPRYWLPTRVTLANYTRLLSRPETVQRLFVSVARVVIGTAIHLTVTSLVAFGLRKRDLKFRNLYLGLFTVTLFFNGGLIPEFLNYRMLGVFNTFLVYVLPRAFTFFTVIIFMSCFRDIPDSLAESAHIDGAGPFLVFVRIYVPLSVAVYATLGLFSVVNQWERWLDTAYFTTKESLETFSFHLMRMVKGGNLLEDALKDFAGSPLEEYSGEGMKYAAMIVAVIPVLAMYPFAQRYFVKGIKIGAVKG